MTLHDDPSGLPLNGNNKIIVAGNCTGATFRVNLDICLEGRTNAIKYSGLLALTKRLSTNKQRTRPVRVQSSFLVFLCNLNKLY